MVSTNISGEKLKKLGYELRDFETAIRDWFIDCKSKGLD
jgi:hypothetical protein